MEWQEIFKTETITIRGTLHHPEAINWMWDYCIHLGPYEMATGEKSDLGVYQSPENLKDFSFAIVYGNEDGQYLSGDIEYLSQDKERRKMQLETIKRLHYLIGTGEVKLHKPEED